MSKKIVLVGLSGFNRHMFADVLESKGYEVAFYVDSYEKHSRVKTIKPSEVAEYIKNPEEYVFFFTFPLSHGREVVLEMIKAQLGENIEWWDYRKVFKEHRELLSLVVESSMLSSVYEKGKAWKVLELFEEEKSRRIVESILRLRETADPDYLVDYEDSQYIPVDVPVWEALPENFIFFDVGAFTGDTLEQFLVRSEETGKRMGLYVGFEPDENNFALLKQNIEKLREKHRSTIFLPLKLACGDRFEIVKIHTTGESPDGGASLITAREYHNVVRTAVVFRPDDMFFNMKVDAIKMDTEGYELNCLKGLQRIIGEYKPTLMVSLYHRASDIYEIPNFVKLINPDYRLYVRVHASFFVETVLYAIPNSR